MRTTIRLSDEIMAQVKRHAIDTHRTITEIIRDAVVALLERERGASSPRKVTLPVFRGDGLYDDIDINNSAQLLDRMELKS